MNILVTDDDRLNRQLVGFVLEEDGHRCLFAENGEVATSLWRAHRPDLILMDCIMPVVDGYAAAETIKAEARQDHIPIIFLTALSQDENLTKCLEVGDDFLAKPINFDVLKAKIRAHERILLLNRKVRSQNQELEYFRNRVQSEHEMARHLMETAQKVCSRDVPGISVHCSAASFFNGDLVLVQGKRDGGAYFLIGDFTGHGLAASVGSIPVAQAFRTMTERNFAVAEIARELNSILQRFLPGTMFFAATLAEISPDGVQMELWCGGLPDAYLIGEDKRTVRVIRSGHMPLGILTDKEFEGLSEVLSLGPRDRLLFYTDGVIECLNQTGEMFGETRLQEVLNGGADDLINAVLKAIRRFSDNPERQDDLSLVEIRCGDLGARSAAVTEAGRWQADDVGLPGLSIVLTWGPQQLRDSDPLMILQQWFANHAVIRRHKDIVFMVITELFNNALEHGVLGLSSELKDKQGLDAYYQARMQGLQHLTDGQVKLAAMLSSQPPFLLRLKVSDSGSGFQPSSLELDDNDSSFGRGLPLIRKLCEKLEFADGGRTVIATLHLD